MSQNKDSEFKKDVPDSSVGPLGAGSKPIVRKKANPLKAKARAAFNPSAAPIPVGEIFKGFDWERNSNVDVVMDLKVQERIAQPYVDEARDYAHQKMLQPEESVDLQAITYATLSIGIARKLIRSVPNSERLDVGSLKFMTEGDFFLPKSSVAAISHIGKFEWEDKKARLKYNSQDVVRVLLKMCKIMKTHTDFVGRRYRVPGGSGTNAYDWSALVVSNTVINSESSATWIRDIAWGFVQDRMKVGFQVDLGGVNINVTYPWLERNPDRNKQLELILAWMDKLNEGMPEVRNMICAALALIWEKSWFDRLTTGIGQLIGRAPAWLTITPRDILTSMRLIYVPFRNLQVDGSIAEGPYWIDFVTDIFTKTMQQSSRLKGFMEIGKQPSEEFGSQAQLIVYDETDFRKDEMLGLPGLPVAVIKNGSRPLSMAEVSDKGLVSAGLIFGFSSSVEFRFNFKANGLNMNLHRLRYLSADIKQYI